jgi:endonuclease YncB( thermonuclease family)
MKKGLLTGYGTIDINQFWPQNIKSKNTADSDADTIKVKIDIGKGFDFVNAQGKKVSGNVLLQAGFWHKVKGVDTFKAVINKSNMITIRVQGIDAPELHYQIGTPLYRQKMGETCTVELYNFLKTHASGNILNCKVVTQVNLPNDVFDMYGRMVADIVLTQKNGNEIKDSSGRAINVNHWLVESGFAFPAFYNSMDANEINIIQQLTKKAKGKNIWKYFSKQVKALDRTLVHSKTIGTYNATTDKKPPVLFPKLFRRLYTFEITNKKAFSTAGYQQFLQKNKDGCIATSDFLNALKQNKPVTKYKNLSDFISSSGKVNFEPDGLVFKESPTTLQDNKHQKISKW